MEEVGSLPSRRQCVERGFQSWDFIQFGLKFIGHREIGSLFQLHSQAGFFHINGFVDIGFQDGFLPDDFANTGEPNLTPGLHILRLLDQNALGIFQQRAFEKQQRTVLLKSVDNNDVFLVNRVTGLTPFQFFGQPAVENDRPQLLKLFVPFFGFLENSINLGIHF